MWGPIDVETRPGPLVASSYLGNNRINCCSELLANLVITEWSPTQLTVQ